MTRPVILLLNEVHPGLPEKLRQRFPGCEVIDGRAQDLFEEHWPRASVTYALPPIQRLAEAPNLRWIQLMSAGVPRSLCSAARAQNITVTNLAGLYGPSIAEHTLALMSLVSRNLHLALRQQWERRWDNSINRTMTDLCGKTVAIVGLGDIGRCIARLARAYGMRVIGCRRTPRPTPHVDRVYSLHQLPEMLAEADHVVVAAPLTPETEGLLGPAEFAAMKPGAFFTNISRGAVAREECLLKALRTGRLAGAALDVFAVEPLPPDHPFWTMPQVVISPHYSGDTVNRSWLPFERFTRNLQAWLEGRHMEGVVNLERGY